MTNPFQGHFDGRGHTVTYSVTEAEKADGLFPYLAGTEDAAAEVRDLKVVVEEYSPKKDAAGGALVCRAEKAVISGVSVTLNKYTAPAGGESAGGSGLAGTVEANALVENCNVKTAAGDYRTFGGIAFENRGTVKNCEFVLNGGESTLAEYGGIVSVNSGDVLDCRATLPESVVSASGFDVGGIISVSTSGSISGCASVFPLTGTPADDISRIGGICAHLNGGTVENCTAAGSVVLGKKNVGGIVGKIESFAPVLIRDCTSNIGALGTPGVRMANYGGGILGGAEIHADMRIEGCVAATDIEGISNLGGILGYFRFRKDTSDTGMASPTFTMQDCHSYAKSVFGGNDSENVGGAIGLIGAAMDESGNYVEGAAAVTTIRGCSASAALRANVKAGGFLGTHENVEQDVRQSVIENCRATGDVWTNEHSAGGFVGNHEARSKNITYLNCFAEGNVEGKNYAGGFIGINRGSGSRFLACTARGNIKCNWSFAGGFVGRDQGSGSVYGENSRGCYAYGAVSAVNEHAGGFMGDCVVFAPQYVSITDCHAFGDVTMPSACGAGFIGEQNGAIIKDCTASGDMRCTAVAENSLSQFYAGFVGNARDGDYINSNINCKAFGNVYGGVATSCGGFAGEWGDKGGNAVISGCESYGSVSGSDKIGGFVGNLSSMSALMGNASYCPELICPGVNKGSFAGNIPDLNNHNISNNKFTEQPDCSPNGGAAVLPPAGGSALAPEEVKVSPKSVLTVALAPVGNATKTSFTFTNAAGYALISFEISTDAGKTYTALVWDKVALVDLPAGALTCANFSYTYAAPCTANTKVRVKISNGTDAVTTEFTYK